MSRTNNTLLKRGETVNNTYEVQCFIGNGAFGEVYRVKHKFMGIQVLKVLKGDYVKNTDLDAVTNEAKILSGLTHRNIVRVFETNTYEANGISYYFLTMGFVSGESLAQLMKRKISLPLPVALSIQIAVLQGLSEAHNQAPPIIHRDISPDNILLSYDDAESRALLSDFGLAQSVDQMSGIAAAAGKYLYLAPECFWGTYLPASDVFSAGVVLYRMLTGSYPWNFDFDGLSENDQASMTTMITKAQKSLPQPPSLYNEDSSENLDRITLKALAKQPGDRYLNACEFLEDLLVEQKNILGVMDKHEQVSDLYY